MESKQETTAKKSASEIFKGLSVREEYGIYRNSEDVIEEPEERPEHGTLQSKRVKRTEKPTKHIAQGLYW